MKAREEKATRKQGKSTDGSTVHGFDIKQRGVQHIVENYLVLVF